MNFPVNPAFDDRTLLQIAVAESDLDRSRTAWNVLVKRSGGADSVLDRIIGDPSARLLPLLGARADVLAIGPVVENRCRHETDVTWGLNVRIFETIRPVLERFRGEGVTAVAFKGLGLFGDVHPDHRLRACGDVDLLIRHDDVRPALAVLAAQGWRVPWRAADPARFGAVAITVCHPTGVCVDLHLRPSRNLPHRRPSEHFPVEPVPVGHPLADTGLVRLGALHHLFVLGLHGARPENRRVAHLAVDLYRAVLTWTTQPAADADAVRPTVHDLIVVARQSHVEQRVTAILARLGEVFDPAPLGDFGRVVPISETGRAEQRAVAAERRRADALDRSVEREPGVVGAARRIRDVLDVAGVGQGPARRLELVVGYILQKVLLVVAARRHSSRRS